MSEFHFLLGGLDLEMKEIENILIEKNIKFTNRNLEWGARLSSYSDLFNDDEIFVAIELIEDCKPPKNYLKIDHHNEFSYKKSSIEQVAELINYKLNRYQQLVAINDRGYIPMLRCFGASEEEIREIRKKDKFYQGVIEQDEVLADRSIKEMKIDKIPFVRSYSKKFSPISDKLFLLGYQEYVIFDVDSLNYYGDKVNYLIRAFSDEIKKGIAYFGGDRNYGFFGINSKIDGKILKKVRDSMNRYSYHIFMLPFRFTEKLSISNLNQWELKKFKISSHMDYNEYTYFHEHIQNLLYNNDKIKEYEFKLPDNSKFCIEIKDKELFKYELILEKVSLHIFEDVKVGILAFHILNDRYDSFDYILKINEYGRRIYPQFLPLDAAKSSFLANSIWIEPCRDETFENFTQFCDLVDLKELKGLKIPNYIKFFLKDFNLENISPSIDDRMFVVSWALSDKMDDFRRYCGKYGYINNEDWYKYLFVDGSDATCKSKVMLEKLLEEHTYDRWIDYGSLFGVTRYSFVFLGKREWFQENIIFHHMQRMYFKMALLALLYRATYLKFSDDVREVTDKLNNKNDNCNIIDNLSDLYADYIKFINKIYFTEITAQEQGIELFDMLLKNMRIKESIRELEGDFKELFEYAQLKQDDERNDLVEKLTIVSFLGLIISSIFGYYGINVLFDEKYQCLIESEPKKSTLNFFPVWIDTFFVWFGIILSLILIGYAIINFRMFKRIFIGWRKR